MTVNVTVTVYRHKLQHNSSHHCHYILLPELRHDSQCHCHCIPSQVTTWQLPTPPLYTVSWATTWHSPSPSLYTVTSYNITVAITVTIYCCTSYNITVAITVTVYRHKLRHNSSHHRHYILSVVTTWQSPSLSLYSVTWVFLQDCLIQRNAEW